MFLMAEVTSDLIDQFTLSAELSLLARFWRTR